MVFGPYTSAIIEPSQFALLCRSQSNSFCWACVLCEENTCSYPGHYRQYGIWHCQVSKIFFRVLPFINVFLDVWGRHCTPWLVCLTKDRVVWVGHPGQNTFLLQCLSPPMGWPCDGLASHPGRTEKTYCKSLHATQTRIHPNLIGHLVHVQTLFCPLSRAY